jgi:excisionase family DNA binding protein
LFKFSEQMDRLQSIDERLSNIETLLLSQKTVLNFDEVSVYTGLSKSHLYKLTSTGGIPCYKPQGKHIYFDKPEIDKWLLQNKKKSNAEIESEAATHVTINTNNKKK